MACVNFYSEDEFDLNHFVHCRCDCTNRNTSAVDVCNLQKINLDFDCLTEAYAERNAICKCYAENLKKCVCGECGKRIEWVWDDGFVSNRVHLQNYNKDVKFHKNHSYGTSLICGTEPMSCNQHYWEVKMISEVYGTDMMVGVGTKNTNMKHYNDIFCSLLGIDEESWGFSYKGLFQHNGEYEDYEPGFTQGSIIGVHLDMWNGTLSFYKNGEYLGIASRGLKGKTLYAMASSTAAQSKMRIVRSCSFPSSLQFLCCTALRELIHPEKNVLDSINIPAGLKQFLANNLGWLLGEPPLDEQALKHSCLSLCACKQPADSCKLCSKTQILEFPLETSGKRKYVHLGLTSIVLQDYNRYHKPTLELACDSSDSYSSDSTDSLPDAKKLRLSYNYLVGLSDNDSD